MNCKDCIHYEVCVHFIDEQVMCLNICPLFKDKAYYNEPPCKIGEYVYSINGMFKASSTKTPTRTKTRNHHFIIRSRVDVKCIKDHNGAFYIDKKPFVKSDTIHFGRYVFTDKSKAEAKLKELNNGTNDV